jgi:hypothetical protein
MVGQLPTDGGLSRATAADYDEAMASPEGGAGAPASALDFPTEDRRILVPVDFSHHGQGLGTGFETGGGIRQGETPDSDRCQALGSQGRAAGPQAL